MERTVTPEAARAYIKQWVETGRLLDDLRWRELAALEDRRALEASDALLECALLVPLPVRRREWSGLVEQQALLHRSTRT
jgi:hypothetical protein